MLIAAEDDIVLGLAVWRSAENTFAGIYMYIDDLITDETALERRGWRPAPPLRGHRARARL